MKALSTVRTGSVALALAGAVVLAGPATPSWAHAELISSNPTNGASLTSVPAAASLTFTDRIAAQFVRTAVTTPAGTSAVAATAENTTVTVPVPAAGPGPYRLVYRVVSADGHPVSGEIRFTVTGTPTATASVPTASAAQAPSQSAGATSPAAVGTQVTASPAGPAASPAGGDDGPPWLVVGAIGFAVLAGGGAVFAAVRGRRS